MPQQNQNQKQFIDSLTKIIEYIERDERRHFEECSANGEYIGEHIYPHICNVKKQVKNVCIAANPLQS